MKDYLLQSSLILWYDIEVNVAKADDPVGPETLYQSFEPIKLKVLLIHWYINSAKTAVTSDLW